MANCPRCKIPLNASQWARNETFKSCPSCSVHFGRHAFYPIALFGERHHEDGTPFIQSYCLTCRSSSGTFGNPSFFD